MSLLTDGAYDDFVHEKLAVMFRDLDLSSSSTPKKKKTEIIAVDTDKNDAYTDMIKKYVKPHVLITNKRCVNIPWKWEVQKSGEISVSIYLFTKPLVSGKKLTANPDVAARNSSSFVVQLDAPNVKINIRNSENYTTNFSQVNAAAGNTDDAIVWCSFDGSVLLKRKIKVDKTEFLLTPRRPVADIMEVRGKPYTARFSEISTEGEQAFQFECDMTLDSKIFQIVAARLTKYDFRNEGYLLVIWHEIGERRVTLMGSMTCQPQICEATMRGQLIDRSLAVTDEWNFQYRIFPRITNNSYCTARIKNTARSQYKTLTPPEQGSFAGEDTDVYGCSKPEMRGNLARLGAAVENREMLPVEVSHWLGLPQCSTDGLCKIREDNQPFKATKRPHTRRTPDAGIAQRIVQACEYEISHRNKADTVSVCIYSLHRAAWLQTVTAEWHDKSESGVLRFISAFTCHPTLDAWTFFDDNKGHNNHVAGVPKELLGAQKLMCTPNQFFDVVLCVGPEECKHEASREIRAYVNPARFVRDLRVGVHSAIKRYYALTYSNDTLPPLEEALYNANAMRLVFGSGVQNEMLLHDDMPIAMLEVLAQCTKLKYDESASGSQEASEVQAAESVRSKSGIYVVTKPHNADIVAGDDVQPFNCVIAWYRSEGVDTNASLVDACCNFLNLNGTGEKDLAIIESQKNGKKSMSREDIMALGAKEGMLFMRIYPLEEILIQAESNGTHVVISINSVLRKEHRESCTVSAAWLDLNLAEKKLRFVRPERGWRLKVCMENAIDTISNISEENTYSDILECMFQLQATFNEKDDVSMKSLLPSQDQLREFAHARFLDLMFLHATDIAQHDRVCRKISHFIQTQLKMSCTADYIESQIKRQGYVAAVDDAMLLFKCWKIELSYKCMVVVRDAGIVGEFPPEILKIDGDCILHEIVSQFQDGKQIYHFREIGSVDRSKMLKWCAKIERSPDRNHGFTVCFDTRKASMRNNTKQIELLPLYLNFARQSFDILAPDKKTQKHIANTTHQLALWVGTLQPLVHDNLSQNFEMSRIIKASSQDTGVESTDYVYEDASLYWERLGVSVMPISEDTTVRNGTFLNCLQMHAAMHNLKEYPMNADVEHSMRDATLREAMHILSDTFQIHVYLYEGSDPYCRDYFGETPGTTPCPDYVACPKGLSGQNSSDYTKHLLLRTDRSRSLFYLFLKSTNQSESIKLLQRTYNLYRNMNKMGFSPSSDVGLDTTTIVRNERPVPSDLYSLMRFVRDFSRLNVSQSFRQYMLHRFGENTSVLRIQNGLLDGIYRIVKISPDEHNHADFHKCSCTQMRSRSEQVIDGCWMSDNLWPVPSQLWLHEDDPSMNVSMFELQEIMSMHLSNKTAYKMMVICNQILFVENKVEIREQYGYPLLCVPGKQPQYFSVLVMSVHDGTSSTYNTEIPTLLGKNGSSTLVSEWRGFMLLVYTVLLLHKMPLVCTRDTLLIVRNAILRKVVDKQKLWRTTFVCSKCNLEVYDFTAPCEGDGVNTPSMCYDCLLKDFQSIFSNNATDD